MNKPFQLISHLFLLNSVFVLFVSFSSLFSALKDFIIRTAYIFKESIRLHFSRDAEVTLFVAVLE